MRADNLFADIERARSAHDFEQETVLVAVYQKVMDDVFSAKFETMRLEDELLSTAKGADLLSYQHNLLRG